MTYETRDSEPELSLRGAGKWILHRLEVPAWGQVLIVLLIAAGTLVFKTISHLTNDLEDVHREMAALDSSVRVLASIQSQSVQNLIHDLLAVAVNSAEQGDAQVAEKATKQLTIVLEAAKNGKVPMKPQEFESAFSSLDKVLKASPDAHLTMSVTKAKSALGDYEKTVAGQGTQTLFRDGDQIRLPSANTHEKTDGIPPK